MTLRFCFLTTFYPPYSFGGDGVAVQRLARALARRGHQVTVLHDVDAFEMLHGGPLRERLEPQDEPEGVHVIPLRSSLGRLSPLLTHQTGRPIVQGRRIRQILAEGRFDVVNFHNVSLIGGPGLLAYGNATKVYMAHEHWLVCPTHTLWRHNRELCTGRECLACTLRHKRPPQLWRFTDYLERQLQHVDVFIALSDFSRRKHREFGFSREMEILPNLVADVDTSASNTLERPHHRPYFFFAGRLEHIKGLREVIPIFDAPHAADLLIAGDGDDAQFLQQLGSRIPRVRFLGRVSQQALGSYYRHAVATIVPSICYETFGLAIIESFREGTPVIARRLGPFPEIIEVSGGGVLFDTTDDLAEAIRRFESSPAERDRYGAAGFRAFCEHWSETAVIPRYLEIVQHVAEKRRQRIATSLKTSNARGALRPAG